MKVRELVNLYDGPIRIDFELAPQVWDRWCEKGGGIRVHGDGEVKGFNMDIYTDDEGVIHPVLEIRLWEEEAE